MASNGDVLGQLTNKLGEEVVKIGPLFPDRISHLWDMERMLEAKALALPRTTDEVSQICKICFDYNQSIVIHGGLSGLVGATESSNESIIISLERLNEIEEVDEINSTMTVQAGTILENIHKEAEKHDLFFPLSFGAKGSAQIGGCIATNAGGVRVKRFGMTRNLILGLETVLADGTIISSLKKIIKNNSGYNLNQLMVGSEGSLGIITKAILKLEPRFHNRNSIYISLDNFRNVIAFLRLSDLRLGSHSSAFEIFWGDTYEKLSSFDGKSPLPTGCSFYVLLETLDNVSDGIEQLIQEMLEEALEKKLIINAAIAKSAKEHEWFWNLREDVGRLNTLSNYQQYFDISVSIDKMDEYVQSVKKQLEELKDVINVYCFGHVADGNLHFVIGKATGEDSLATEIDSIVYSPLKQLNGSISAEHGIGIKKKKWLGISRSQEEIDLMRKIKLCMDPKLILNRGVILNEETIK